MFALLVAYCFDVCYICTGNDKGEELYRSMFACLPILHPSSPPMILLIFEVVLVQAIMALHSGPHIH